MSFIKSLKQKTPVDICIKNDNGLAIKQFRKEIQSLRDGCERSRDLLYRYYAYLSHLEREGLFQIGGYINRYGIGIS